MTARFSKKLLSLLTVISILFLTVSCGEEKNREYNEAEVRAAATELIKATELLNEIYYGEGIPWYRSPTQGNGTYQPADDIWLDQKGFTTVQELKKMTTDVYTKDYCDDVFASIFESMKDVNDNINSFARYIQIYDDLSVDEQIPLYILVNTKTVPLFTDEVEYHYDTLRISRVKGQKVYAEIGVTVTNSEGKSQNSTIEVALLEEADGWRLDEPTYIKYNAS